MLRSTLAVAVTVALSFVSTALGDGGPSPGAVQGDPGVLTTDGLVRYVTLPSGSGTILAAVTTHGGRVSWTGLPGNWGIPAVAFDGTTGGLSQDASTLVLAEPGFGGCTPSYCSPLRATSRFDVLAPKKIRLREKLTLRGDFAYDALSPNGHVLYLIQHVSKTDLSRYLVRAYDLTRHTLRPGAVADRAQRGWVMQGSPMARATSDDGRFVYTLYQNPGGYPFVHALDTVAGTAHCIGIPLPLGINQGVLNKLALSEDGRTLDVDPAAGRPIYLVDTRTYRVTEPPPPRKGSGFGWWLLTPALMLVPLGAALTYRCRRRTLRNPAIAALG